MLLQLPPTPTPTPPLNHHSQLILRSPSISPANNSGLRFREKLHYLEHTLRVDPTAALSQNPSLRSFPLPSLLSLSSFLSSFGLPPADSGKIFRMYPQLLTCDPSADLLPTFRFLLGPADIPSPDLPRSLLRCPRLLVSSLPHQLYPSLLFLRRLGFRSLSPSTALLLVSSVPRTLLPKLLFLRSLGLSRRDVSLMVLRSPALLTFGVDSNLRPKARFLAHDMRRSLAEARDFPHYFSFSLDRRIRPRHRMALETHGAQRMPLEEMLRPSDGEFRERLLGFKLSLVGEEV